MKREDRRRRSRALVPRYYKFESISLQQRVRCELEADARPVARTMVISAPDQLPHRGASSMFCTAG